MPPLAKIYLTLFTASWVLLTSLAQGAYNGDIDYSGFQFSPANRGGACLGTSCVPPIRYATQNFDCNLAGYGTPRAVGNPNPVVNPIDLGLFKQRFFSNLDPAASDLNSDGTANSIDLGILRSTFFSQPPRAAGVTGSASGASRAQAGASRQITDDERIIITGSRIRNPAFEEPVPVVDGSGSFSDDASGLIRRRMLEVGPRFSDSTFSTYQVQMGLRGDLNDSWSYDAYLPPGGSQFKAFPDASAIGADTLPDRNVSNDYGFSSDPVTGWLDPTLTDYYDYDYLPPRTRLTSAELLARDDPADSSAGVVRGNDWDSLNFEYKQDGPDLSRMSIEELISLDTTTVRPDRGSSTSQTFGNRSFGTVKFDPVYRPRVEQQLQVIGVLIIETNWCRIVLVPTDPSYTRTGRHDGNSWGARLDDQWAIKRVGFTDDEDSAWNQVPDSAADVVVAVIDTGLDWHHLDMDAGNIWRNPREIPDNNIDDDNNGYVDDIIGWNFMGRNNQPWDYDGHGTVVAGIIAAAQNNNAGIAGINPHAKIMVLKGVNNFGTTRASFLAEAIKYAADNGAKIINISVGGPHETEIEKAAIAYAHSKGVLIIAASGNEGVELDDFGPGGNDNVLTVGATHTDDRVGGFSNFGDSIDLVAPGVDVLSLRARFTDVNYRPASGEEYEIGTNYVGEDKRYIHVSGTSFSTPIVTGVASLLLAKHPQLSAADVERLLIETAEDVESPGKDKYAGHGMVDARAALSVDPDFFITAEISGLEFVQTEEKDQIHVKGSIGAGAFKRAWVQIGAGDNPAVWKAVGQKRKLPIENGTISTIDLSEFAGSELWQVLVNVEHRNGVVKKVVRPLRIK